MALHNPPIVEEVAGETPTGTVDGSNTVFTTLRDFEEGTLKVYLNGQRVREGGTEDYTTSGGNTITFNDPPEDVPGNPDVILVDYTPA